MANRFKFTGKIRINRDTDRNPWVRSAKTKNGNDYISINLIVSPQKNNSGYVEIFGVKQNEIKTTTFEGENIVIDWENRFDEEVVNEVASYRKHVLLVDSKRTEYITDYDFANAIAENISDIEGKTFTITGQIRKNIFNGKISDRFQIQNIYETVDDKMGLRIEINPFFWNKNGLDVDNFEEEKKIFLDGYTSEYIDKENPRSYVPQKLVLDCKKIDFENEKHIAILNYKLKQIGLEYNDKKIKIKNSFYKGDNYKKINLIVNYMNGAEESEFSIDDLTENQREAVELGLQTLESLRPRGTAYGNRVTEYKIVNFDLREEYSDGAIDVDENANEFEDNIYFIPKNESIEEIEEDLDEDDLFS